MKLANCICLGILLGFLNVSAADKILFLLPVASKSHVHVFEPLIRELGLRGHDIVNLSPVKSPKMSENVKQIQIFTVDDMFGQMGDPFEMRKMGKVQAMVNGSFNNLLNACGNVLKTDTFQNILEKERFDLIIWDVLMNYCLAGAMPRFNAPTILVTTLAAPGFISTDVGNRLPPSFVPDMFANLSHKMTFIERFLNVIATTISSVVMESMFIRPAEKLYRELLSNGESLPGIHEIQGQTSMVFMNSHHTLTYPRPLLPDVIEVGGMHCGPSKPLEKTLDEFLNQSGDDGFIFFSLGSIVPAKMMPEETRKIFVRVFSRLKQRVLWKWETESMPDAPPNVLLKKWLSQQDVLGHPKIKLFITHGGLLSTQEAVYHGVPLLGIPMFGDQDLNIKQAENAGYAKFFEILDITEENLEKAIGEMLNQTSYTQRAKELSVLVRDLPQTPLEKAVYWTEYVLRHKGAPHLRSAARDLNFFQYYVLDVIAVLILIGFVISYVIYKCVRMVVRKICGGKGKGNSDKLVKKAKTH